MANFQHQIHHFSRLLKFFCCKLFCDFLFTSAIIALVVQTSLSKDFCLIFRIVTRPFSTRTFLIIATLLQKKENFAKGKKNQWHTFFGKNCTETPGSKLKESRKNVIFKRHSKIDRLWKGNLEFFWGPKCFVWVVIWISWHRGFKIWQSTWRKNNIENFSPQQKELFVQLNLK